MALKLHLLESFALAGGGHHAHMAAFIHRTATARGLASTIYGHRKASAARLGYPVTPTFTRSMHAPFTRDPFDGPMIDMIRGQRLFAEDLAGVTVADEDLILLPTATVRELSGLLRWLGETGATPRVAALFHRSEDCGGESLAEGSLAGALVRSVARLAANYRGPLWLGATNEALAAALAQPFARAIAVAAGTVSFAGLPPAHADAAPGAPARIGFPGAARAEKQPGLARAVAEALARRGDVHAILQSHGDAPADAPPPGIEILDHALDDAGFAALIASLDLIVLPYDAGRYAVSVSGVFDHAAALGVPAIVPAGTTMAGWIARGEAAGLCFTDTSANAIVATASRALAELPALRARARALAAPWRAAHSGDRWLSDLLAWAS